MSFYNELLKQMERSTAGSEDTARKVMELCGKVNAQNALFFGDDLFTPSLIKEKTGADLLATFYEDYRAENAEKLGMKTRVVGAYEIAANDGGWDFIWFNGSAEPDGVARRFEQLREGLKKGRTAVYRTLCWLIDPSPDTRSYVERRFGRPMPLDRVVISAKEQGFKVLDFYISPRSDWLDGYYRPMNELLGKIVRESDGDDGTGIGEVNKETYMFELHSEEYSYVYYILG
ncbi:MAG: hypothetical protein K2N56_00645 [Oscillospiraceae bacterium]|nr:hypothetical protein [Oscillospiraceae bacterium]